MLHALFLGLEAGHAIHAASLLRCFDAVSGACRGDQALALIARRPVQVVAIPDQLEDMSGAALAASIRRWHPRHRPRLVLLSANETGKVPREDRDIFDAMIAIDRAPVEVTNALFTVASVARESRRFDDELQGTFDDLDFASLVQVIAQGEKTGRLIVRDGRFDGCLLYRQGLLIHAASCGLDGRDAFRFLLTDFARRPRATFCFEPLLAEALAGVRPTIACQVEQLLLEAA